MTDRGSEHSGCDRQTVQTTIEFFHSQGHHHVIAAETGRRLSAHEFRGHETDLPVSRRASVPAAVVTGTWSDSLLPLSGTVTVTRTLQLVLSQPEVQVVPGRNSWPLVLLRLRVARRQTPP